jgi:hypothetical protein
MQLALSWDQCGPASKAPGIFLGKHSEFGQAQPVIYLAIYLPDIWINHSKLPTMPALSRQVVGQGWACSTAFEDITCGLASA